MIYHITPDPKIPKFDPNVAWVDRFLAWLRGHGRPRMAVILADNVVRCHPASVPAVQRFLTSQGHKTAVVPLLRKIEGEKK